MDTNYHMLRELDKVYTPKEWGICNQMETQLIQETLCISDMDILQLRNLRDFTVMYYSSGNHDMTKMDKMSAITYIIDRQIIILGGTV